MLSWTLSNGIITATNGTAIDRWVITELTANRLVFKFNLIDRLVVSWNYLKPSNRYEPPVISIRNFFRNKIDNNDKIALKWDAYRAIISLKI
jgi:hypothetical protein